MDEIMLLNPASAMVDGVYQDICRRNSSRGCARTRSSRRPTGCCTELGSDHVEAINAISGERCNPHPHNFTDRIIRPGDQAFFDIIQSYNGYRTCYYRTFNVGSATAAQRDAYTQAREWMDRRSRGQARSEQRRRRRALPKAQEFGFDERDGRFRPAVRARPGPRPARAADHLAG